MELGKVPESILKRSILKQIKNKRAELIVGPSLGEDAAVLDLRGDLQVFSSQQISGEEEGNGRLGVIFAANNLAAQGADPVGVSLNLLLPENFSEAKLKKLMQEIQQQCEIQKLAILGGHTQTLAALPYPILTLTGVGRAKPEQLIKTAGMRAGDEIILTKYAGLYGTLKLIKERRDRLLQRYAPYFLQEAQEKVSDLSIAREAKIAREFKAAAMHDVSSGGVFAALWELAEATGLGVEIWISKILILQHTVEVCEFFDLNPYQICSNGSLLIATDRGNELLRQLRSEKIPAAIIGKATQKKDKVVYYDEEKRFLERPRGDVFPI